MGILDDSQNVVVETGGIVVFVSGVLALGSAGGLVPFEGVTMSPILGLLVIVVGLYLMGYKKLGTRIEGTIERFRK